MNKEEYVNSIFDCDNQEFNLVYCDGREDKLACKCGSTHFYELVNNYIVCTKCFTGYSCNESNCYIKKC